MRFAYINSQGKEVSIPSVEALQLRIELGAIVESTMFYDEGDDRWAPAAEHDIFRSLSRQVTEKHEGGFVAPPPPTLEPAPEPPRGSPPAEEPAPHPPEPPAARGREPASPWTATSNPLSDLDFGLTPLTDEGPPMPAGSAGEGTREPDTDGPLEPRSEAPDSAASPLDGLTLEKPLSERDFGGDGLADAADLGYPADTPPGWVDELPPDVPPGAPLAIDSDDPVDLPGSLGDPPWEEPSGRRGATGGGGAGSPPDARAEPVLVRAPMKPSRRRSRRARRVGPALRGIAVLVLLGGAGWLAFSVLQNLPARGEGRTYEAVTIPPLAPELETTFRTVAEGAFADVLDGLEAAFAASGAEPPRQWLAGAYLAGASQHPQVPAYWTGLADVLNDFRAGEAEGFATALDARLEAGGPEDPTARAAVRARAVAGFQAALPDRDIHYDLLASVLDAAMALHEFLVANEASIDYDPAVSGVSRDPVLEAVPATPELGEQMWERVDRLSSALESLGALGDGITTDRMVGALTNRLAGAPVR